VKREKHPNKWKGLGSTGQELGRLRVLVADLTRLVGVKYQSKKKTKTVMKGEMPKREEKITKTRNVSRARPCAKLTETK